LLRQTATYTLAGGQAHEIKQRMLNWANQFSILLFLDSNQYPSAYPGYECLLAAGQAGEYIPLDTLADLQQLHDQKKDWLFGHICYDYKNIIEPKLTTTHQGTSGIPQVSFFVPQTVCYISRGQTEITIASFSDPEAIYNAIMQDSPHKRAPIPVLEFKRKIEKDSYLETITKLRSHIIEGDCYEINYCTEGYCENTEINPAEVFRTLNTLSPAPFAAYYRQQDQYMMCASPERYLRKEGRKIISQPIKGTARRDNDPTKDKELTDQLRNDLKERAENVMITDLVRNDLARCCKPGTVQVDELFGIYTFPQVHQMISTVSGTMKEGIPFTDAIRYSFPMGSMTGAPKFKVMQLIDDYEISRRGLYSGTVGYITPDGDFDLNVVIRSLFYNQATRYLSYQTGGAITYDSDPEREWEEMRLKAWALEKVFKG
jgi:para-aminobenzoate synthetase component 1